MFKKVTNIVIFALIFALYFVSFLMIYDSFRERKLESLEKKALDAFEDEVKIEKKEPEKETKTSSSVSYSGFTILGKIEIPKIGFSSVIIKENTSKAMNVGVVKSYGDAEINEDGGFVLSAHNFRGKDIFFYNIKNLKPGDIIRITDTSGLQLEYTVYETLRNVNPEETSYLNKFDSIHATLVTCENGGKARIVVKARVN
jgi:LPXTG-site transpeptidase (sortase) family protein